MPKMLLLGNDPSVVMIEFNDLGGNDWCFVAPTLGRDKNLVRGMAMNEVAMWQRRGEVLNSRSEGNRLAPYGGRDEQKQDGSFHE